MNWLAKYRHDNDDISQVEVAKRLGVSQAAISMWETGERKPSTPEMLQRIETLLGIPRHVVRPDLILGVVADPKSLSAPADVQVG